jgi:NAD(P)-dependent dehydrogenase (short-subunit alcohol dehydrogenase family)
MWGGWKGRDADSSLVNNAGGAVGTERVGDIKLDDIDYMVNTNRELASSRDLADRQSSRLCRSPSRSFPR